MRWLYTETSNYLFKGHLDNTGLAIKRIWENSWDA